MLSLSRLFILTLFILLSSCSTINQKTTYPNRKIASITGIIQNCSDIVSSFVMREKVDFELVLSKLKTGERIKYNSRKALSGYLANIKDDSKRLRISKKIESNIQLSKSDLSVIRREVEPHIYQKQLRNKWSYRKRYVGGEEDIPITYGLEVELLLKDNPNIVDFYKVGNISDENWMKLSQIERLKRSQEGINKAEAYEEIFLKLPGGHSQLPDTIFVEGHKTIEANGMIFNSIGETEDFLKWFSNNIGRGSFQGHVAYRDYAKIRGVAGYIIFESDYAQLNNLERGYSRFLKDNDIVPSKSLVHHSLGPLSEDERALFLIYEDSINNKQDVTESIGKAKTILGPNFRPGYPYPDQIVGYEHRQYHKNFESLIEGMDFQSRELEVYGELSRYKKFDDMEQISNEHLRTRLSEYKISTDADEIELLFISIGEILEKRADKHGMTLGGAAGENRFFFPLKDWRNHEIVTELGSKEYEKVLARIQIATQSYLDDVVKIVSKTNYDSVDDDTIIQLQILNAKWGHDANISYLFNSYRKKIMNEISSRGPPNYHTTPKVKFAKVKKVIVNKSGKKSNVYKVHSGLVKNSEYLDIKENSVEIIFEPHTSRFGHIVMRVGEKEYSFNFNRKASVSIFDIDKQEKDARGFVYNLSYEQIESMQKEIEFFYISSKKYNIPPFDAFGKTYEVVPNGKGKYLMKREDKYGKGEDNVLLGEMKTIAGTKYIVAKNGTKVEVIHKDGKDFVKGLTCASSARTALKEYLGLDIGPYIGADSLNNAVLDGTIPNAPDYIFQYAK